MDTPALDKRLNVQYNIQGFLVIDMKVSEWKTWPKTSFTSNIYSHVTGHWRLPEKFKYFKLKVLGAGAQKRFLPVGNDTKNMLMLIEMCDAPVGSSGEGVAVLHPAALIVVTQGTWVWCPAAI